MVFFSFFRMCFPRNITLRLETERTSVWKRLDYAFVKLFTILDSSENMIRHRWRGLCEWVMVPWPFGKFISLQGGFQISSWLNRASPSTFMDPFRYRLNSWFEQVMNGHVKYCQYSQQPFTTFWFKTWKFEFLDRKCCALYTPNMNKWPFKCHNLCIGGVNKHGSGINYERR